MGNYKKFKGNDIIYLYPDKDCDENHDKLSPGVYKIDQVGGFMSEKYLTFQVVKQKEELIKFKTGIVSEVLRDTDKFFSDETKSVYKGMRISHKMGILFYGKPGTGKTCTCSLIMNELVNKRGAICIIGDKSLWFIKDVIGKIRKIQNNPIVIFSDEFDGTLNYEESAYLTFLDGDDSVDDMIFIGCTNHLDKIPERFKNRKSRIKHLYAINSLPDEVYREYVFDRIPTLEKSTIDEFVFRSSEKGLTIDQLKHALIDYRIEGVSIENAVEAVTKTADV